MDAAFATHGSLPPASPIILSVPHAGRAYPAALMAGLRVAPSFLTLLEDRHVDAVALAARTTETMLVQQRPRAWIDLNRAEHERDPQVDEGAVALATMPRGGKVEGGLGLVPRRAGSAAMLWRRRWSDEEVQARIMRDHRPYHAALTEALDAAQARFGSAVLLDIHSMPPLAAPATARVVIGDRFGRSASARMVARVEAVVAAAGLPVALNAPYAGGHVIERHAARGRGRHAIQLELDRTLYLDARLDRPGSGLMATAALVRGIIRALEDEVLGSLAIAAE
ncbi:MAG TPA: N-formylglutamate amidohydrolase [Sphingomonas sp.]